MQRLPSSFRDPCGFVYQQDGIVRRKILPGYFEQFAELNESGLYQQLIDGQLLIEHQVIESGPDQIIIEPQQIEFVSYPYEWSFGMLKDAALLTLKIARLAIEHGMYLKDATAFNVQMYNGRPIHIDTLSFEFYQEGKPWHAYGQFCRHFLGPLLLARHTSVNLAKLSATFLDGVPLDLVSSMLPAKTRLSPFIATNIHLHARSIASGNSNQGGGKDVHISKKRLQTMLQYMQRFILSLTMAKELTEWGDYYNKTNYSEDSFTDKEDLVKQLIVRSGANRLWDAGGNNGHFLRLLKNEKTFLLCTDIDPIAIESSYQVGKRQADDLVLSLIIDLTNPSAGIGFDNKERDSFVDRVKAANIECTLALALIHHLCIANNCPLAMVFEFFATLSAYLLIEFVPPEDSYANSLLVSKREFSTLFTNYNQDNFELRAGLYFEIVEKHRVGNSLRSLYLMKSKAFETPAG